MVLDNIITISNFVVIRILNYHTYLLRLFPLPAVTLRFPVASRAGLVLLRDDAGEQRGPQEEGGELLVAFQNQFAAVPWLSDQSVIFYFLKCIGWHDNILGK